MAQRFSDSIPDTINGSNPTIEANTTITGFTSSRTVDTDVYRLALKAGQGYLLQAAEIGTRGHVTFSLLDENGDAEAATNITYNPTYISLYSVIYDRNSDYFFKYNVDTTLFFSVEEGIRRQDSGYEIRLTEVESAANTDQDDILRWDNAIEFYSGGEGVDTLSFSHFNNPVQIKLHSGSITGTDIIEPTSHVFISDIERIEGTNGNDLLIGDDYQPGYYGSLSRNNDAFQQEISWLGLDGDDTLGTTRGATLFDGGNGIDTADYTGANRGTPISVSLLTGLGDGGEATGDRLISIENLIGSSDDDTLTGDHGNNLLNGGDGFDRLMGLGGDDTLDGGGRPPYIDIAPDQLDRAVFRFDRSEYTVNVSTDDHGRYSAIVDHTGGDQSDGRDTVTNIALLEFADKSEFIGENVDTIPGVPGENVPTIVPGQLATIRHNYPGDVDLYAIELQAGQTYRFSLENGDQFGGHEFELLDSEGRELSVFGLSPPGHSRPEHEFADFQVSETGRYFTRHAILFDSNGSDEAAGYSGSAEKSFRIKQIADISTATDGNDTIFASQDDFFIDAGPGEDRFVSDLSYSDITVSSVQWYGYLSKQAGDLPTFFLHKTTGHDPDGQPVQLLHNYKLKNVETLVGSEHQDFFKVVSRSGHRAAERLTFEGKGGDDVFESTLGPNHFDGGEGNDTINYLAQTSVIGEEDRGVYVDLLSGVGRHGLAEGDTYTSIEVVIGTLRNDVLIGAADTVQLVGYAGDDWITAGPNGHIIDGGFGTDMVSFVNLPEIAGRPANEARLVISTQVVKQYGSDDIAYSLSRIENITGSVFNDEIEGNGGDNLLRGSGGYDWFIATEGEDTIDGGSGKDMISFVKYQSTDANVISDIFSSNGLPPTGAQASGVLLNLADPSVNTKLADGLTLTSVERVTGSARQDVFYGDDGENDFRGLGGYDWFVSSTGGRERYFGGDGVDTVTYFNAASGVTANLSNGARVDGRESGYGSRGVAARDLYFEIENLVGSRFADELRGSSARNQLNGLEGDDLLFGYGGTDYLMGGLGNDRIYGGSGSDYAIFSGNAAGYQLSRAGNTVTVSGADGVDTLIDVEYFRFDDTDVSIWSL